jgi:predicted DNA-binding protein with PD1-like motif
MTYCSIDFFWRTTKMRIYLGVVLYALLLSGCVTNLSAVRGFADETKKIGVAFDPILGKAVEHCRQRFLQRRIYTTDVALAAFDAESALKQASETCKPIEDENATAKRMSKALADYASQLSALAAGGVASSVSDDFDALAAKLGEFKDAPKEKIGAIASLLKYITRSIIAKSQHDAIIEALSHEEAVGALANALVVYTDRVYEGYLAERLKDQPELIMVLRAESASPISSRLRLMDVYQQTQSLAEQQKATAAVRTAVGQMKVTMRDLRQNVDQLSAQERISEVQKLAKDVRNLYDQLAKAF